MKVLGLVFTKGVSLKLWYEKGLIDREKLIYEEYIKRGIYDKIYWFTYGTEDIIYYKKLVQEKRLLEEIEVYQMPKGYKGELGEFVYSFLLPFYHKKICKQLDIIKTNQMPGAWTALIISRQHKIPFYLRTGYTCTQIFGVNKKKKLKIHQKIRNTTNYYFYKFIEAKMYQMCDIATVSSQHDKTYIEKTYECLNQIEVLPNYIDCSLFKVNVSIEDRNSRFLFVGRLSHEKNLFNTIRGVCEAGFGIDIYGDGGLKEELQSFIQENNYDAKLCGLIDNAKLPNVYNSYKFYILASPFEGMPKTLLEAMACGVVCFATNSSGMKEIIQTEINGYLIDTTEWEMIRKTIEKNTYKDLNSIHYNATLYVKRNHSIGKIMEVEQELINSCKMK